MGVLMHVKVGDAPALESPRLRFVKVRGRVSN